MVIYIQQLSNPTIGESRCYTTDPTFVWKLVSPRQSIHYVLSESNGLGCASRDLVVMRISEIFYQQSRARGSSNAKFTKFVYDASSGSWNCETFDNDIFIMPLGSWWSIQTESFPRHPRQLHSWPGKSHSVHTRPSESCTKVHVVYYVICTDLTGHQIIYHRAAA